MSQASDIDVIDFFACFGFLNALMCPLSPFLTFLEFMVELEAFTVTHAGVRNATPFTHLMNVLEN